MTVGPCGSRHFREQLAVLHQNPNQHDLNESKADRPGKIFFAVMFSII
jgi:hypothetical protein